MIDDAPAHYHISRMDWTACPDVESVPGRCSGQPVVRGTRILVQGILDNAAVCTAEEIATEIFPLPVEIVRRILAYRYACIARCVARLRVAQRDGVLSPPDALRLRQLAAEMRTLLQSYAGR